MAVRVCWVFAHTCVCMPQQPKWHAPRTCWLRGTYSHPAPSGPYIVTQHPLNPATCLTPLNPEPCHVPHLGVDLQLVLCGDAAVVVVCPELLQAVQAATLVVLQPMRVVGVQGLGSHTLPPS